MAGKIFSGLQFKAASFYFGEILAPKRYPEVMVAAVSAKQLDEGMMNSRGAMECLTPCELQHALVFRVAELITQKSSETILSGWLRMMLSTMFVWELYSPVLMTGVPGQTVCGSPLCRTITALPGTVLQKVYHLGLFRQRKERELGPLSAARVAQIFNQDTMPGF